jgi:hypothetical protein
MTRDVSVAGIAGEKEHNILNTQGDMPPSRKSALRNSENGDIYFAHMALKGAKNISGPYGKTSSPE